MLETKEVRMEDLSLFQAASVCVILNQGVVKFEFLTVGEPGLLKTKKHPNELFRPYGWEFNGNKLQKCNPINEEENQGIPVIFVDGELWG